MADERIQLEERRVEGEFGPFIQARWGSLPSGGFVDGQRFFEGVDAEAGVSGFDEFDEHSHLIFRHDLHD